MTTEVETPETQILCPPYYHKLQSEFTCLQAEFSNPTNFTEIGQICKSSPLPTFSEFLLHLQTCHQMDPLQKKWTCNVCENIYTCEELYNQHFLFCQSPDTSDTAVKNEVKNKNDTLSYNIFFVFSLLITISCYIYIYFFPDSNVVLDTFLSLYNLQN